MRKIIKTACIIPLFFLLIALNACSVNQIYHGRALDNQANWVLLPVVNDSQTPQAGERMEAILVSLLRSRGVTNISHYPKTPQSKALMMLDDQSRYNAALKWALTQKFRYAITGTVEEWRYKAGLDGEPAVGITLRVIDLHPQTEKSPGQESLPVPWSATGARTGWGREGIAAAAYTLLNKLLDGMTFITHDKEPLKK